MAFTDADSAAVCKPELNDVQKKLLNDFQKSFPLSVKPYADIAASLEVSEAEVLNTLRELSKAGVISRVGPVFRPHTVGASTLAAMATPPERLLEIADYVSAQPEVNHNYEREHRFNLWFVVTAATEKDLSAVLLKIEQKTGISVMYLPMLEGYHVDLGFRLFEDPAAAEPRNNISGVSAVSNKKGACACALPLIVEAVQSGLPLVSRPYAAIGKRIGLGEAEVIGELSRLQEAGIIKRFGVVVRHRKLGYRANAMLVLDLPDEQVAQTGRRFARFHFVTLCYRRPRRLPHWPYNLFCMIHGLDRSAVLEKAELLVKSCGLDNVPHQALFSGRCFKQRGAIYRQMQMTAKNVSFRAEDKETDALPALPRLFSAT
ncbi:MAG: Lrp/AsnC family transcriptional regulator [Gammaproteobacteria bacterium]|nr:Lrp/AsnC family transcriptional regulator [Gammaproteobacteria bacterium]